MAWEDIVKQNVIKSLKREHEEQMENIIQMLEELSFDMDEDGDYLIRQILAVDHAIERLKDV